MSGLLVRDCQVAGPGRCDVRVRDGRVAELGPQLRRDGEEELPADGGALLPGLHDHHLHLLALAADLGSVRCGPPDVSGPEQLAAALRTAAGRGLVRGTGYHESVAGWLDRDQLDALVRDTPVRVQHRSGAAWFLNSAALDAAGLTDSADAAVERDAAGRPTGRLLRGDQLLRGDGPLPDLTAVGRLLATYGVTGVTDATPRLDPRQVAALRAAHVDGGLPQRLLLLGEPVDEGTDDRQRVPWKVLVDEVSGLDPSATAAELLAAHARGRPVAIHCTSRPETVLAVTLLVEHGAAPGDRLEHAGVLPPELDDALARRGVTVVTQPHFIAERGDDYLADVEPDDHPLLYRCGSLLAGGIPVAAGTDAPYGHPDPWRAIAAAVRRQTRAGAVVGAAERVTPAAALRLFLGEPLDPGGPARQVTPNRPADLCLLAVPLDDALADPRAEHVAATIVDGRVVFRAG
jgi:predicted amidohydrolase YtcJ